MWKDAAQPSLPNPHTRASNVLHAPRQENQKLKKSNKRTVLCMIKEETPWYFFCTLIFWYCTDGWLLSPYAFIDCAISLL